MLLIDDDCDYKLVIQKLHRKLQDNLEVIFINLFLFFQGNRIPYGRLLFKINPVILFRGCLGYYVFYEFGPIHLYLEIKELK